MTNPPTFPPLIEGRCEHKTSNALKMTFSIGPDAEIAEAHQGAGDGKGSKAAVLFGFKNGGTGKHVVTYTDGTSFTVQSQDAKPTLFTRPDGTQYATIERGDTSTALDAAGRPVLVFAPDPEEDVTVDLYRLVVTAPDGSAVCTLDVIRRVNGWSVLRALDAAWSATYFWNHAGAPLKVPIHGARIVLAREVNSLERDLLLGACVDIAIGLRPYIPAMK